MRWILINSLLLASLAVALPNERNKRDFTFLKNLVQKILYGKNEINVEFIPSSEEATETSNKFRLYELPGYDDVLIKVPVGYGETNPEESVNLNAFGSTVGTKSSGTLDALKDVNNLVSSGILDENHDKVLKGSFEPMFPRSEESESNEDIIRNSSEGNLSAPVYTEGTEPLEDIENFKEPVEEIHTNNHPQNEELPMMYSAQRVPETIQANSDLPNCDQLRVDTGILIPADQYQVAPAPATYPAPSFVNVFYPNLPANQDIQSPLYPPKTTDRNHHSHHKHSGHRHYSHHQSHHRKPHHYHHHDRHHHHLHTKLNDTSTIGNETINNDEVEGSTLSTKESTTEDPVNRRVQFVSRLTNTETFQGINMGSTVQDTNHASNNAGGNTANPIAAGYGSNQYVYRNQDNLKMVTFEDKLKTNNNTNTKEPSNDSSVTSSKDEEFGVKQNTLSNVTADKNIENTLTSTERIGIEGRLSPERSRKLHVHHHKSRHPSRHHHHRHHHRHHHAINPHPLQFHIPQTFGLNGNPNYEMNENGNFSKEMANENNMANEIPLQKFGDHLKKNVETKNDTDASKAPGHDPLVSDSTESTKEFGVKKNNLPSETAHQNDYLPNLVSTETGDTRNQDALSPERLKNGHVHHRSRHPSRRHPHHHRRGHHSHVSRWPHKHKYVQLPNFFDSDAFKSIMNANTLYTNKITENPVNSEEPATKLYENKLKENEWKPNGNQVSEKLKGNSADNQNNTDGEQMGEKKSNETYDSKSRNRGDIPDE